MTRVKAIAPATVANVTCGFDIFGFAVERPFDEVIITLKDEPGVTISKIHGDGGRLPISPEKNTAGVAVNEFFKAIGTEKGATIELTKNLPLGSGMGSSAASSVAALVAINHLLGKPFKRNELLPFAMEAERVACGSGHADNVAPSLLGGFVLVRGYDPLDVVNVPTPDDLFCTLVHPQLELKTEDSRKVLKVSVQLRDAVRQWGNIAGLVAGLMKPDYDLISRSMHDYIVEPIRSVLIPGFDQIKDEIVKAGALGSGISGSGPTIFALSKDMNTAVKVGDVIQRQFNRFNVDSEIYVSRVNQTGATVI
ncbi:MAG TPA: homoserine kinase [Cyclobacteriaceae bacterium]|nr:homoserine kinase [Cyclobacteriaceae bacterium]